MQCWLLVLERLARNALCSQLNPSIPLSGLVPQHGSEESIHATCASPRLDCTSAWDSTSPPLPSSVTIVAIKIMEEDALTWALTSTLRSLYRGVLLTFLNALTENQGRKPGKNNKDSSNTEKQEHDETTRNRKQGEKGKKGVEWRLEIHVPELVCIRLGHPPPTPQCVFIAPLSTGLMARCCAPVWTQEQSASLLCSMTCHGCPSQDRRGLLQG